MENGEMYRQGDVLIIRISDGKDQRKEVDMSKCMEVPREDGAVVLAHGEVTGHAHRIMDPGCHLYVDEGNRLTGEDAMGIVTRLGGGAVGLPEPDRLLVVEGAPVVLKHEEHSPIELAPGQYVVRRQREYDPEALRAVED